MFLSEAWLRPVQCPYPVLHEQLSAQEAHASPTMHSFSNCNKPRLRSSKLSAFSCRAGQTDSLKNYSHSHSKYPAWIDRKQRQALLKVGNKRLALAKLSLKWFYNLTNLVSMRAWSWAQMFNWSHLKVSLAMMSLSKDQMLGFLKRIIRSTLANKLPHPAPKSKQQVPWSFSSWLSFSGP